MSKDVQVKYPVLKGFFDAEDVLKSGARHYIPGGRQDAEDGYSYYPATKRDVDEDRVLFLQEEGYIGEPIEVEEGEKGE